MADKKLPEYLQENDDGSFNITLRKPLQTNGASVGFLRMREPTVADQLAANKGSDAERETSMVANLCSVTPAEIRSLTLRDYRRVQEALVGLSD